MDRLNADGHHRRSNPYYPFKDETEWKFSRFLVCSSLTQTEIDKCLKLDFVHFNSLFFWHLADKTWHVAPKSTPFVHVYLQITFLY